MLKTLGPVLGVEVRLWDEGFLQEQFLVNLVLILAHLGDEDEGSLAIIGDAGPDHHCRRVKTPTVNFPMELVEDILRNTTGLFLRLTMGSTANIFSSNKKMVQLRAVHR